MTGLYRFGAAAWWMGPCPTAAIARLRLDYIVPRDREKAGDGRWVRVMRSRLARRLRYRWEVRR